MRTTLTLDDDLAVEIKRRARREGAPLKQVINSLLRAGLNPTEQAPSASPHVTQPHHFGLGADHDHARAWDLLAAEDAADYLAGQPPGP